MAMLNQEWLELKDIRRGNFSKSVWIPLRAVQTISKVGKYGYEGFSEEHLNLVSVAVPRGGMESVNKMPEHELTVSNQHGPHVQNGKFVSGDVWTLWNTDVIGTNLVLDQLIGNGEPDVWHLHHDLVIGLGLKREGDVWVCPKEGYSEVARLTRDRDGVPRRLDIKAEHLKDYLCARDMVLRINSYRSRKYITTEPPAFTWEKPAKEVVGGDRWEGRVYEIHEGGNLFGAATRVFHVARKDVDPNDDVPTLGLPADDKIVSKSWAVKGKGRKLYVAMGELWRGEWIEKGESSSRIAGDKTPPAASFIVDATGTLKDKTTLVDSDGRWLWFKPDAGMAIFHRRGGKLEWYSRDTGKIGCPSDYCVHFGINRLGLINVYAKDIGLLPDWLQRVWAGFNVAPDGGVSDELQASQVRAVPAATHAPEPFFIKGLERLDEIFKSRYGVPLLRRHDSFSDLVGKVHRFRAVDQGGLFSLAKDIARLTADSINVSAVHDALKLEKKDRGLGSLKSLERLVASVSSAEVAHEAVGPLFGIYELRLADAHWPATELDAALALVEVDKAAPFVIQAEQMLSACVSCLYELGELLEGKS